MKDKLKIVIADDHPMIRDGLRNAIEPNIAWEVVGEAKDGEVAIELINKLNPAIDILDISMPVRNGFEVVRALRQQKVQTRVIFLTMHRDEDFFQQALDLGVRGYVLKDSAVIDVVSAIKAVSRGEHYTSPALTSYLIRGRSSSSFAASSEQGL